LVRVTPSQLKAYAAIVRLGSAKAAAQELGVSEAAISSHASALRKEFDDVLYRRQGKRLAFTPGGLRLATRAVELLGLQDQTLREVSAAASGQRLLRLAVTSLFAEYAAPGLLELFKTRADDLAVEMSVHGGDRLAGLLTSRQADVVVGPQGLAAAPGARTKEFLRYEMLAVVGPRHRLAGRRCKPAQASSEPWLLGPSAIEPHGATGALLRRFRIPEDQQRIFQSHAAALAEVEAGAGVGLVPKFRVKAALDDGRLHELSTAGAAASGLWSASTLPALQSPAVASELLRFITTPRATQAMLTGSGANIGHFRPSVHVTLWS